MKTTASEPQPSVPPGSTVDAPQQIGRYRILGRLGAGGMGVVYLAVDTELQRRVAVKVPHWSAGKAPSVKAVQRFLREARAAAAIRHPHVCPLHDIGQQDGCPYVVMPLIEGASLADRLRDGRRIDDPREAVRITAEIADALAAVHAHGIVHRDLKPGNILLDNQGNALLTDFGLARPEADQEHLTAEGGIVGTPAYMAPEQASGSSERIGPRTDLYGLGVVLYHALTGRLPYEGSALAVVTRMATEPVPPPSNFRPGLDPRLEALILRAMARDPDQRFGSAEEMARALRDWLEAPPLPQSSLPSTVTFSPVSAEKAPSSRGRKAAVAAVIGFCLLLLLVLVLWLPGFQPQSAPVTSSAAASREAANDPATLRLRRLLQRVADVKAAEAAQPSQRVSITWDVEQEMAMVKKELPFVIGVLADLQGNQRDASPLNERKFIPLDRENFSLALSNNCGPLKFTVPNRLDGAASLQVELKFEKITDFEPMGIIRQVPALETLLGKRRSGDEAETLEFNTQLDRRLSAQLVEILHHTDFRRLEATWRGLHYLVHHTPTGTALKIRIFHATQAELLEDAQSSPNFQDSALYRKLFEEEFGQLSGEPYGLLVGDYEFGPAEDDLFLLARLAQVAEYGQVPFIAAASSQLLGEKRFADVAERLAHDPNVDNRLSAPWRQFRTQSYAVYVGLTAPRVLARLPYGDWGRHLPEFVCEEFSNGLHADELPWMSAAWPFAAVAAENFSRYGWFARVCAEEGGGRVEGLPRLRKPSQTGTGSAVEVAWSAQADAELARQGILTLWEGEGQATPLFLSAASCYQPGRGDPEQQARATTVSRLNVVLCSTRFTRSLMVMGRDKIGSMMEIADFEKWLRHWLHNYMLGNEKARATEEQARFPVTLGKIEVQEVPGQRGWYQVILRVRPTYQFDPPPRHAIELRGIIPKKS